MLEMNRGKWYNIRSGGKATFFIRTLKSSLVGGGQMQNIAKINLAIEQCKECPYCRRSSDDEKKFVCRHQDATNGEAEVGDGSHVPDFCPFILKRLQAVYDYMTSGAITKRPKSFINQIEHKCEDQPNPKFGADHGFGHIKRVTSIGLNLLDQFVAFGYVKPESVEREKLLLKIAAYLHDIGLADQLSNHAAHSAEMASKYLNDRTIDIDPGDIYLIYHAISNHSAGLDTKTAVDAVLILADKLDTTGVRIKRALDDLTREQTKITATEFRMYREPGNFKMYRGEGVPVGAELRYTTKENFNVQLFMKEWPKAVLIPRMVALEYLNLKWFKFIVNNEEVNITSILH
jgi:hypothetical protein